MGGGRRKKKPFIDKHNAVKFHVLHRSQRDPLQADESAPQHVLVPLGGNTVQDGDGSRITKESKVGDSGSSGTEGKRLVEQRKYGVYYDDDYDYLQHLRDVNETTHWHPAAPASSSTNTNTTPSQLQETASAESDSRNIHLPSSVFASSTELQTGLLNKAAPHSGPKVDWDPDIVAALDDDFDYENEENVLEDDFMARANASECQADPEDEWESCSESEDSEVSSSFFDAYLAGGSARGDAEEDECKSRFTEYSMTSSVLARNDKLTLLDEQFEHLYSAYDDAELGALDSDDELEDGGGGDGGATETRAQKQLMSKLLSAYKKKKEAEQQQQHLQSSAPDTHRLPQIDELADESLDTGDIENIYITEKPSDPSQKWDCESILSTYSNLYNHPTLIEAPKKISVNSAGIAVVDGLDRRKGLTKAYLASLEKRQEGSAAGPHGSSVTSSAAVSKIRVGETPEQRRDRKKAVREQRKERRVEKKCNKVAFREEDKRRQQQLVSVQQNVTGLKMSAANSAL